MDQVKAALAWLKEHHFWVLALIVVGAVVGVWYSGSSSLASQYQSNKSKITGEWGSIEQLLNAPFKPNEGINKTQLEEAQEQAEAVLAVWRNLYQNQKENVLIWPSELSDRFVNAVQDDSFGDPISSSLRELYLNYIENTFPSLVEIVDAELIEEGSGPRRAPGGFQARGGGGEPALDASGEPLDTHLVQWLDQGELRARLDLERIPSAIQIWVLQEDLWVYQTLLKAIAATNEATGATRSDRAAVQTIYELKVGQSAAGDDPTQQRLVPPDSDASVVSPGFGGGFGGEFGGGFEGGGFGGGGFEGGGGFGGGRGGGFGGGEFGGGGGFGAGGDAEGDPATALLAGRYLDQEGQPIQDVPPDYNFGREFKRLPVRIVVEMDTRWLTKLMWELANAPLQVEIEQVRFNPEGAGRSTTRGGGAAEALAFDRRPTLGTVTLQGIVYLFNEPDPSIAAFEESF